MNPATKGIQYDPSYDTKGKAMTSILIGYEDWIETELPTRSEAECPPMRLIMERRAANGCWSVVHTRYFVPPKPKPTLPDVTPGAVVRYVDLLDRQCRAIKLDGMCRTPWRVFTNRKTEVDSFNLTDEELLNDGNADGFTVELDGL